MLHLKFIYSYNFVQGTAGVALAGILGALRAQGRPMTDLMRQKVVVVGAGRQNYWPFLLHNPGFIIQLFKLFWLIIFIFISKNSDVSIVVFSAGLGVLNMAVQAISRMAGANGVCPKHQFYLIDKDVSLCLLSILANKYYRIHVSLKLFVCSILVLWRTNDPCL